MMYSKIILFSLFFNIFNSFSLDQTQEINYLPIELQLIVNELKERNAILIEMLRQENILFFKEI